MLQALTQLLVFQLVGEVTRIALDVPIPGPVLGLLFLLFWLLLRNGPSHELRLTTSGMLQHLSLFYVPAGVGIMLHAGRIEQEWLPILAALLISTAVGMAVTGVVMQTLLRRTPFENES